MVNTDVPTEANKDSILQDVKKVLGIHPEIDAFDLDVQMHINSVFATLHQLGVGPKEDAFFITGPDEKWQDFTTDNKLASTKSYIVGKVRMAFDPPANSFTQESLKTQLSEYEFRLNVAGERNSND